MDRHRHRIVVVGPVNNQACRWQANGLRFEVRKETKVVVFRFRSCRRSQNVPGIPSRPSDKQTTAPRPPMTAAAASIINTRME